MTEEQARSHAEALALGMGITIHVVRSRHGRILPVQVRRTTAKFSRRSPRPAAGRSIRWN